MPDLFSELNHPVDNLLPFDGTVSYIPGFFSPAESASFFARLRDECDWKNDEVIMFGKKIVTPRKSAWYGDRDFGYRYSGITRRALPWTEGLQKIKEALEIKTGQGFNSCLLNLYHTGGEGMGWHADDEPEMKKYGAIGSISLGASRRFVFKHKKTGDKAEILLENGSLLLMAGTTQEHWVHALPKAARIKEPRINLTFRTFVS